jgi:hypothetical protein
MESCDRRNLVVSPGPGRPPQISSGPQTPTASSPPYAGTKRWIPSTRHSHYFFIYQVRTTPERAWRSQMEQCQLLRCYADCSTPSQGIRFQGIRFQGITLQPSPGFNGRPHRRPSCGRRWCCHEPGDSWRRQRDGWYCARDWIGLQAQDASCCKRRGWLRYEHRRIWR